MNQIKSWLKAKFFLLSVAILWLSMIAQLLPLQLIVMIICIATKNPKWREWNYSIWMIQDQLVNVILSGHHLTTVSSTLGMMSYTSKTAQSMRVVVDYLFKIFAGQKNHCRAAIEVEDVHRYSAIRAALGLTGYVASYAFFIYMTTKLIGA